MRKYVLALAFIFFACANSVFAADTGLLIRNGFSSVTPTANQTWVLNTADLCLYAYDGTNYQKQTPGRIQPNGSGPPTSSNDSTQGFTIGSFWFDAVGLNWYVCLNNTAGSAVWNVFTNRVALADIATNIAPKFNTADIMGDFVASGLLGTVPSSSLTMTTPAGVAYVTGLRAVANAQAYTYPASKDTYDYLSTAGIISHTSVANGAGAPVGPTGLLVQKVVTGSSAITSVTQMAAVAPTINVATATPSTSQAIPITQADGRYAPASALNGPYAQGLFIGSPVSSTGAASARAIAPTDLPTVPVSKGGTGYSGTPANLTVMEGNGTSYAPSIPPPSALCYLRSNAGNTALEWAASAGISSITVTDASGYYTITPSPLNSNGTITLTPPTYAANNVLAGPSTPGASNAYASPRLLVPADCPINVVQVRLACVSGSPYADSSGSSSSSLYIEPLPTGNQVLFQQTGGNYQLLSFAQTAVTMSGNTANVIYDVYVKDLLGTVTVSQAAWSSNTPPTRGTDTLNRLTKNGDTTSLLIGCYRAVAATTTVDDASSRWVSNVYNPIKKRLVCIDTTATVVPAVASTWVTYNANTTDGTDRFSYVQCIANFPTWARNYIVAYNGSGSYYGGGYCGIGFNSTSTVIAGASGAGIVGTTVYGSNSAACEASEPATVGYNYYQRMYSGNTGSTYYADPSGSSGLTPVSTSAQTMIGEIYN
jgi:hypothetical protein